jgi:hypothetical protein
MHPVADARWTANHGDFAESRLDSCRTVTLQQGTPVRCNLCHENKL